MKTDITDASVYAVWGVYGIPSPWQSALLPLLAEPFYMPTPTPPIGVQQFMEANTYAFQSALDWMVRKEWNSKHKVRGDKKLREFAKPLGVFLTQIYYLCDSCTETLHEAGIDTLQNYLLASRRITCTETLHKAGIDTKDLLKTEWFKSIFVAFCAMGFQRIMYDLYLSEQFLKPRETGKKKRTVRELQAICSLASGRIRPSLSSELIAFAFLLDTAIGKSEASQNFYKKYKQFIESWRKAIEAMEEHWMTGYLTEGGKELHSRIGKGRCTQNLTKEYFEVLLKRNQILNPLLQAAYKS